MLWYRQPAKRWLEALPLGNGRIGAMVFGGVSEERLALNESTFWSGEPSDQHENSEASTAFTRIRELFKAGKYTETQPLFRFIEALQAPGQQTAKKVYGISKGWVCHVFSNAWGYTAPGWGLGWGLHVVGGVFP